MIGQASPHSSYVNQSILVQHLPVVRSFIHGQTTALSLSPITLCQTQCTAEVATHKDREVDLTQSS